jgi:hypothetical protein
VKKIFFFSEFGKCRRREKECKNRAVTCVHYKENVKISIEQETTVRRFIEQDNVRRFTEQENGRRLINQENVIRLIEQDDVKKKL